MPEEIRAHSLKTSPAPIAKTGKPWERGRTRRIPADKRCGFVQFADRYLIFGPMDLDGFQAQPDPNQWNIGSGGYYGYAQGYKNYGYALAGQDTNMYGSYPGYANYQSPQQQQQMGYS